VVYAGVPGPRGGLGEEQLASLRQEAEGKLAEVQEKLGELNAALRVGEEEMEGIDLPEIPEIPEGETPRLDSVPYPLIDSDWEFVHQSQRLIAHKAYENGSA
jgi:hypothetical protein